MAQSVTRIATVIASGKRRVHNVVPVTRDMERLQRTRGDEDDAVPGLRPVTRTVEGGSDGGETMLPRYEELFNDSAGFQEGNSTCDTGVRRTQ